MENSAERLPGFAHDIQEITTNTVLLSAIRVFAMSSCDLSFMMSQGRQSCVEQKRRLRPKRFYAAGTSLDAETAYACALSELVERVSAFECIADLEPRPSSSFPHSRTLRPSQIVMLLEGEQGLQVASLPELGAAQAIRWTKCRSYSDDSDVSAPLACIGIFEHLYHAEKSIPQSSVGLATHVSEIQAKQSALYEVVEKLSIALAYSGKAEVTAVSLDLMLEFSGIDIPLAISNICERVEIYSVDCGLPISTWIVIAAVVVRNEEIIVQGAAAHADNKAGLQKAYLELAGILKTVAAFAEGQIGVSFSRLPNSLASFLRENSSSRAAFSKMLGKTPTFKSLVSALVNRGNHPYYSLIATRAPAAKRLFTVRALLKKNDAQAENNLKTAS